MNYLKLFETWKTDSFFDESIKNELLALNPKTDSAEIEDRFYRELEFGTAGLRGIMGAGTNRMNKYTVGKATAGFGAYLLKTYGKQECFSRGVVVCYDTRNNSREFAEITATVFSGLGIKVFIHANARPIPELSFSIRKLRAVGGVMITASHNPKEYNGYKIYDESGCQLVPEAADKVTAFVNAIKSYKSINFIGNKELVSEIDITEEFCNVVLKQSRVADKVSKQNLKVVYTPLHGTGFVPITTVLKKDGFKNVFVVKAQSKPDGDFSTVALPNPEDKRALEMGIILAKEKDADLVIGTDPDADRIGAAVKTKKGYELITGNQMGALLVDFLLNLDDVKKLAKPAIVKSIVTSAFGAEIAKKHGASVFNTLTGFKFIGERMNQFQAAKFAGDTKKDYDYVIGYEESYGYLVGTHARDKDSVVSAMLIAEMAAKYKSENKTLINRLNELYKEVGYFYDTQDSFTLKGKDGLAQIKEMMKSLRNSGALFAGTEKITDYNKPVKAEFGFDDLDPADVLMYELSDGSWVAVRPSGTEPKIKLYYSIKGKDEAEAVARQQAIRKVLISKLNLE